MNLYENVALDQFVQVNIMFHREQEYLMTNEIIHFVGQMVLQAANFQFVDTN